MRQAGIRGRAQWWGVAGLILLVGALVGPRLWADMVITENDTQYEGDVISDDQNMIILQTDRGLMYFNKDSVKATMYKQFPKSSAKVEEVIGTAEYQRKDRPEWRELNVGTKLRPGDVVRTGADSKVIATVAGQAVVAVEAESQLTISDVMRNKEGDVKVRLALDAGQLWNDVGQLRSTSSQYTVETPQASCGVRGTVYTVLTSEETAQTTVATVDGRVSVFQKAADGAAVDVGGGEQVSLAKTGDAQQAAIDPTFTTQWDGYRAQFQRLRVQMQAEDWFARLGLTPQQGYMAAGGLAALIVVVGVVFVVRRRR